MIITPTITAAQNTTLTANNLTVDGLLKTLIEYKIGWMKARSSAYVYNGCTLTVTPSGGSVTTTVGQDNFLLLDFKTGVGSAEVNEWVQNFVDETVRHLDLGEPKVI